MSQPAENPSVSRSFKLSPHLSLLIWWGINQRFNMFSQSSPSGLQCSKQVCKPISQLTTLAVTQSTWHWRSQQVSHCAKRPTEHSVSQAATQPVSPPPVPANLVRNQLRLCLLSSPCLQLICSSLMQLSCVLRAERHNKVIRLIRLAAPLLSPYAHYTYSIRCVMRFCTPSTRCRYACSCAWEKLCVFMSVCMWKYDSVCVRELLFLQRKFAPFTFYH